MAYNYNSNKNRNRNNNKNHNRNTTNVNVNFNRSRPARSGGSCTSSIISAITRAYNNNVISYSDSSNMLDYVTRHPYMRNCSQGIHSIITAYNRNVISYSSASNQIWNLLRNS